MARIVLLLPVMAALQAGAPSPEYADVVQLITTKLAARGIVVDNPSGAPAVRIACSRNLRERVCAAEIKNGTMSDVVIAAGPLTMPAAPSSSPTLFLDMRHVFGESAAILDIAIAGDRLYVLDRGSVALYQRAASGWQRARSQSIAAEHVWPRDMRGRLRATPSTVEVFLPGAVCRANAEIQSVSCADERQPWPMAIENTGMTAGRNYFTTPEGVAFYSFASLDGDAGAKWLLASDHSRLVLLDEARRPLDVSLGTGDEVAGISTTCSPGAFALVSRENALHLIRIASRRATPASAPLVLPGSLTALWSTPGASTATAIVRDATGRYDAFFVDVACGR